MELSLPMPWPVGRCVPPPSTGNNSFYSSGNFVRLLLIFSISPLFLMQGIVATCSAPVAVTRRCPFPASSSSSPAESANPATAASTPAAPAWTSNWTSPSLLRPTEFLAWEQQGSSPADPSPRTRGSQGPRLGACAWSSGRGALLGRTDLEDVPLDRGILLVQLFPLSCLSCLCVRVPARACVYI